MSARLSGKTQMTRRLGCPVAVCAAAACLKLLSSRARAFKSIPECAAAGQGWVSNPTIPKSIRVRAPSVP